MEKQREVKVYEVKYYCDKCGEEVSFTGYVSMANPPTYKHNCKCGEAYWLRKQYPTIEYK